MLSVTVSDVKHQIKNPKSVVDTGRRPGDQMPVILILVAVYFEIGLVYIFILLYLVSNIDINDLQSYIENKFCSF